MEGHCFFYLIFKNKCYFCANFKLNFKFAQIIYNMVINRTIADEMVRLSRVFPVVVLTGPRQSGKTTLCRSLFADYYYANLENITMRNMIADNPLGFINQHRGGLIVDEAQRMPEILSYIQVVVDEVGESRIVVTGSSNFALLEGVTQSLAGRAAVLTLLPLSLAELQGATNYDTDSLMLRGGYPAVWGKDMSPEDVYSNYYTTYIERDLRQIINIKDLSLFQRCVALLAGSVGMEFNASKLSAEIGVSSNTIQQWFSVLEASYIVYRLPPYFRNIGKRLLKTPKLYFYDVGLACYLLGINDTKQLSVHPLRGHIFENYVVSEMIKRYFNRGKTPRLFFFRDSHQKEVDIVEEYAFRELHAYEIKSSQRYSSTFASGLTYFKKLFGEEVRSSTVVYDGTEEVTGGEIEYVSYRTFLCKAPK